MMLRFHVRGTLLAGLALSAVTLLQASAYAVPINSIAYIRDGSFIHRLQSNPPADISIISIGAANYAIEGAGDGYAYTRDGTAIHRLTPTGTDIGIIGIGLGNLNAFEGAGDGIAYVLDGTAVHRLRPTGTDITVTAGAGITELIGAGDGYAYVRDGTAVHRLTPTGFDVSVTAGASISDVVGAGLGFGYVLDGTNIHRLGPTGVELNVMTGVSATSTLVGAGDGVVYLQDGTNLHRIGPSGVDFSIATIDPGTFSNLTGAEAGVAYAIDSTGLFRYDASGATFLASVSSASAQFQIEGAGGGIAYIRDGLFYHRARPDGIDIGVSGTLEVNFGGLFGAGGGEAYFRDGTNTFQFKATGPHNATGVGVALVNFGGMVGAGTVATSTYNWDSASSGNWISSLNWDALSVPFNENTATVVFGSAITSPQTVISDLPVTVKGVQFDNANSYAIAGTGGVNLTPDTGNASVDVVQGPHQFQAVVNLGSVTDVSIASGASLAFNNALNNGGNNINKTGAGMLEINSALNTGAGVLNASAGIVGGVGLVSGDLNNTGATVAPGNSPGTLSVGGDYTQGAGGTLAIEIAGTSPGEFDVLDITGSATLDGILDISLLSFVPFSGDTFDVLMASSITDNGLTLTGDMASEFDLSIVSGSTLRLTFNPTFLEADFNENGLVNAGDLSTWEGAFGSNAAGDTDSDGDSDGFDFLVWQRQFGSLPVPLMGASSASAVPEPSTLGLLGIALVGLMGYGKRQRNA